MLRCRQEAVDRHAGLAWKQLAVIEEEMRALHVPRRFEPDRHRLRIHLKMLQESLLRTR